MRSGGSIPISKYTANGLSAPADVDSPADVRNIQKVLGVKQSGVWDVITQSAWKSQFGSLWMPASKSKIGPPEGIDTEKEIKRVQSYLDVAADGVWGEETQNAWEQMRNSDATAIFTQTIIDKGRATNEGKDQNAPTRIQKNKQQNLDWQIRKAPTAKKAEVFLQTPLYKQRMEADNRGIEAMSDLYSLFIARGNNKDAKNILTHIQAYHNKIKRLRCRRSM